MTALAAAAMAGQVSEQARIGRRVMDALLREDVRGLASRSQVVAAGKTPFFPQLTGRFRHGSWLRAGHLGPFCLWLPVESCGFMQDWRLKGLPLAWQQGEEVSWLDDITVILMLLGQGADPETRRLYERFVSECRTAVDHGAACGGERRRFFDTLERCRQRPWEHPHWAERALYYDRLAAFLDHPFYPTARAKQGFSSRDLERYAPEFQPRFRLRWLAVPRSRVRGDGRPAAGFWPQFSDVGLPPALSESHVLLPVHPFLWQGSLAGLLRDSGLEDELVPAPRPFLETSPTLSVRTVVVRADPYCHLKLPLPIRTLGGLNLRTIKPSTIADGHVVQSLLRRLLEREPGLRERVLLTDEGCGAHLDHNPSLAYILRRYPAGLEASSLVPVAGLLAPTPQGRLLAEELAGRYFGDDIKAFFDAYLDLTLRLHLVLWLRYGIALEANQQNSVLVLERQAPRLRLLLKDNDAARIDPVRLRRCGPELAAGLERIQDRRILAEDPLALGQMFTTITFQLNIAVLVEGLAKRGHGRRQDLYGAVRARLETVLAELERAGEDTQPARRLLLEPERHYLKYLLRAASLESKRATGASDVNKFYGHTAPNPLRP